MPHEKASPGKSGISVKAHAATYFRPRTVTSPTDEDGTIKRRTHSPKTRSCDKTGKIRLRIGREAGIPGPDLSSFGFGKDALRFRHRSFPSPLRSAIGFAGCGNRSFLKPGGNEAMCEPPCIDGFRASMRNRHGIGRGNRLRERLSYSRIVRTVLFRAFL